MGTGKLFSICTQPATCIYDQLKVTLLKFAKQTGHRILSICLITWQEEGVLLVGDCAVFIWWPRAVCSVKQLPLCLNCLPSVSRGQIFRTISSVWVIIAIGGCHYFLGHYCSTRSSIVSREEHLHRKSPGRRVLWG